MNHKELFEALINGEVVERSYEDSSTKTYYFIDESTGELRYSIESSFQQSYLVDSLIFSDKIVYKIKDKKKYYRWKIKRHGVMITSSFFADEDGQTIDGPKIESWDSIQKEKITMSQEY